MFPNDNNFEANFSFENESGNVVSDNSFHALILGNWSGDARKDVLDARRPIEIDRDNFDDVIKQCQVSLNLNLANNETETLTINFEKLEDFHPDSLFNCLPIFQELKDIRNRLLNPKTYNSAAQEIISWSNDKIDSGFSSDSQNESQNSGNLLDQILSQSPAKDEKIASQNVHNNELRRLVNDVVRPHLVNVNFDEQEDFIKLIDARTSSLMRQILHHQSFQKLESAWRALDFLVRNVETGSDLKISIFDVSKNEISEHLKTYNNLFDAPFYQTVFGGNSLWTIVAADFSFAPTIEDTAALIRLTKMSASGDSAFISHFDVPVVNFDSDNSKISEQVFDDDNARKLWTTLRVLPESEYLGLLANCLLARVPYGKDSEPLENFDFEEFDDEISHENYLWANPCFYLTLLLAQTFRQFGEDLISNIAGKTFALPPHIYKHENEAVVQYPVDKVYNVNETTKLLNSGLMSFVVYRDSEQIRLSRLQAISLKSAALRGKWE